MSDNDGTIEPVEGGDDTNLDDFAAAFFGKTVDEPTVDEPEDVESDGEVDESDEDTDVDANADAEADESEDEGDESAEDESEDGEEDEESDPEPEEKPHKNRKSAKERISELARERREERLAKEQAVNELNALKARLEQLEKNPAPVATPSESLYPDPDELNEKNELVYPLGKLDPAYNAEVTRRTIRAEMAENAKKFEAEQAQREQFATQQALVAEWNNKLTEAEKTIPDLRPKIADLEDTFADLDPDTGVFLAETIMTMPRGVEVLNYLADNIGEAEELVALNPRQAVITLGRIEGRLPSPSKEGSKPKVSKAPKPPIATRGVGVAKRTPGDTDNLEAFEREFFQRK